MYFLSDCHFRQAAFLGEANFLLGFLTVGEQANAAEQDGRQPQGYAQQAITPGHVAWGKQQGDQPFYEQPVSF